MPLCTHKRFIVPSEFPTNQGNQENLSLFQFPILQNSNQSASPLRKSADPLSSFATLMKVDQSTNIRETTLQGGSSKEKSTSSGSNHPKSLFKATKPHKETLFQTLAISSHSISISETLTIPQKDMVDFLEDIVTEADAKEEVILIEDENKASLDLNRPQFSFDPIFENKWLMTIHNTEAAWKILDGVNFLCEWKRTEDSLGKLKSKLEKRQLKWESSFNADFLAPLLIEWLRN